MVTATPFGVTYLYWKESNARKAGTTLQAAHLVRNSDCDNRLGGPLHTGISRQDQFNDPSDAIITTHLWIETG